MNKSKVSVSSILVSSIFVIYLESSAQFLNTPSVLRLRPSVVISPLTKM